MQVKFNQVSHYYEKPTKKNPVLPALDEINLTLGETPEFVCIVGKTGAGKSTLLQHINGLMIPTSGTVNVGDLEICPNPRKNKKMKEVRSHIGFAFQFPEYQLFEETVLKDIMYGPKTFGMKENEAKENSIKAAKMLGIESLLDESPFSASGGQQRKIALAGILSYDPDVLLLDEPTRGLDPKSSQDIMNLFYGLYKNNGKTIIMITHDMNIVYEYATRVVVMKDAKICYVGSKEQLFSSNEYQNYDLEKPDVLEMVDKLNNELNYNLSYNIHSLDELLASLKEVKNHE